MISPVQLSFKIDLYKERLAKLEAEELAADNAIGYTNLMDMGQRRIEILILKKVIIDLTELFG